MNNLLCFSLDQIIFEWTFKIVRKSSNICDKESGMVDFRKDNGTSVHSRGFGKGEICLMCFEEKGLHAQSDLLVTDLEV